MIDAKSVPNGTMAHGKKTSYLSDTELVLLHYNLHIQVTGTIIHIMINAKSAPDGARARKKKKKNLIFN